MTPPPSVRRHGGRRMLGSAAALVGLLGAGLTSVALADPSLVVDHWPGVARASTSTSGCRPTEVAVAASPEVAPSVRQSVQPAQGRTLPDGTCLQVVVREQDPSATVRATVLVPANRLPSVWVPDSSLWLARVTRVRATPAGSFATSPIVLATSQAAVGALGWGTRQPTWAGALAVQRPVAVPELAGSATGLLAVLALRTSTGGGLRADQAVAATVLAAQRAGPPTPEAALETAARGAADAPLVPASEQAVFSRNRADARPSLVAVYPQDGSPSLDYPVVRLAPQSHTSVEQAATDVLVQALLSTGARDLARRDGFRQPGAAGPGGQGVRAGTVSALELPPPAQIQALLDRLATLAEPIRMLTLIDVSPSMAAEVSPGLTRIGLVRDAAKAALQLLPDRNRVGVWVFSAGLAPGVDHAEVAATAALGDQDGSVTHRRKIAAALDTLPGQLRGNGAALYSSTLAAVQRVSKGYDLSASNVVVVLTDGTDGNSPGLDRATLLARLKELQTPARPVRLIAVGIGPTADMSALRAMAAATPNGKAYQATDALALKAVLFDALSSRR